LSPGARETAEWDDFLGSIHNQVLRMTEFVNNLLEVSRMRSGQTNWNWGAARLREACDEAMNVLRPLVDHSQVELSWLVQPEDLVMQGDIGAVTRMLINLISNAARFTPSGSVQLAISAQQDEDGQWVRIVVSDTGTGISADMLSKLGKAFLLNSGAIGSDQLKGTGLGLAICNTIAAVHGGRICVCSREGVGTTFTVHLRADLDGPVTVGEGPEIVVDSACEST